MEDPNYLNEVAEKEKKKAEYNNISVISYAQLQEVVSKWLLIVDPGVVKLTLATIIANKLPGDPVWLFLIAQSGGGKTEIMNGLLKIPDYYPLSQLTPNTFLSGYKSNSKEPSLLKQLGEPGNKTLGFKDFTSVLDSNKDAYKEIMGQFRDLYDGYMVKRTGTGDEISWKGKMGFIAGCTPIIEQRMAMIGAMGERFMSYKIDQPNSKEVKKRIRENTGKELQMRMEIQDAFAGYLKGITLPENLPELPEEVDKMIESLADFIALVRAVVMRSYDSKREIEYINQPEMSTRIYKQLYAIGLTLFLMNENKWQEEDSYILKRLAVSSVHSSRHNLIKEIQSYKTQVKTSTLATVLGYPTSTTRRHLEDLAAISMDKGTVRILKRTHQGVGKPDLWELTQAMREILKDMGDGIEPTKEDNGFEEEEKDLPVGASPPEEEKLNSVTAGMSEEEQINAGLI